MPTPSYRQLLPDHSENSICLVAFAQPCEFAVAVAGFAERVRTIPKPVAFTAETIGSAANRTLFGTKTVVACSESMRIAAETIVIEPKQTRGDPPTIGIPLPTIFGRALRIVFAAMTVEFGPMTTRSIGETTVSTPNTIVSTAQTIVFDPG